MNCYLENEALWAAVAKDVPLYVAEQRLNFKNFVSPGSFATSKWVLESNGIICYILTFPKQTQKV